MANIATLLARILTTRYGRDMRQDLHDAIEAVNDDTETALGNKLTFTNNTRKLKLLAKDDTVLSEVVIPGGGSGGGSVDSVNGLFPDENGNVELNLDDINDVDITSASDGQTLVYDATSGKWVNGSGGGGTTDYTDLTNKPSINGVTLSGNKTSEDLGISGGSNENLLLNPWFQVNTTGKTSVSTINELVVDEWRTQAVTAFGTISISSNGLVSTPNSASGSGNILQQLVSDDYISKLNGKTLTFSILYSDGTIKSGSVNSFNSSSDATFYTDANLTLAYRKASSFNAFRTILYNTCTVRALKLELGSASTLALDVAPNENLEKVRCNGVMRSNRNLLDNPWFTINQRGFTSTTSSGKLMDRWATKYVQTGNSFTLNSDNSFTISNPTTSSAGIYQGIENLSKYVGKQLTFSIMYGSNNDIFSYTFTYGNASSTYSDGFSTSGNFRVALALYGSESQVAIYCRKNSADATDTSVTIKAMKLELGTESTLALDVAPNYTEELLKCQRYYYPLGNSGMHIGRVYQSSLGENMSDVTIILPTAMRTTPTYNNALLGNDFSGHSSNLTNIEVEGVQNIIIRGLWGTTPTYGVGYVQFGYSNQPAYLSAEL